MGNSIYAVKLLQKVENFEKISNQKTCWINGSCYIVTESNLQYNNSYSIYKNVAKWLKSHLLNRINVIFNKKAKEHGIKILTNKNDYDCFFNYNECRKIYEALKCVKIEKIPRKYSEIIPALIEIFKEGASDLSNGVVIA